MNYKKKLTSLCKKAVIDCFKSHYNKKNKLESFGNRRLILTN